MNKSRMVSQYTLLDYCLLLSIDLSHGAKRLVLHEVWLVSFAEPIKLCMCNGRLPEFDVIKRKVYSAQKMY